MVREVFKPSDADLGFFGTIKDLIRQGQDQAVRQVNSIMVHTYFEIGLKIVEREQGGADRATYGAQLLKSLSSYLSTECGKGYSVDNLERARRFYLLYKNRRTPTSPAAPAKNSATPPRKFDPPFKLSWSHYVTLLKIPSWEQRDFYEIEATSQNWSLRELDRQVNSAFFERLELSRDKDGIRQLAAKGQLIEKNVDALKQSYVLEFLDLREDNRYSESDLETAIINRIEKFMLELGKGFLYEGRQKRISFEGDHFFIDLVFYNRLLRCFILVDLKIGKLTHQDIGQMQMYVNYYDRMIKAGDEKPTIGIILCKQGNNTAVKFTLPENNDQIFAREYQLYLPSQKELKKQLD